MPDNPDPEKKKSGGIIIRGADGALYFLRDELLEETRLPSDLIKQAEQLMREPEKHRESFEVKESPKFNVIGRVEGDVGTTGTGFRANMRSMSTVMCPSFLFTPGGEV